MEHFMEIHLLGSSKSVQIQSAEQAVHALVAYQVHLGDADTILTQFSKITRTNSVVCKFPSGEQPYCGIKILSKVEHHRILRAILRLQTYEQIRKSYGTWRKRKRRIRALFSRWTPWGFDEVRSVAEWIILEHKILLSHYADGIQSLFKTVASRFEKDIKAYVRRLPTSYRDRNRRSKFAKHPKKWDDTRATAHEGSAGRRNKDWNPIGYDHGCYIEHTQVYRQFCQADGYPF